MATPFEVLDTPLVRATVILGHDGAIIMLSVHHAIADGISVPYALRDLLQIMWANCPHYGCYRQWKR